MDKNILQSLDSNEKKHCKKGFKASSEQTYVIENEYKILNENYNALRAMMSEVIFAMVLWIMDRDKKIIFWKIERRTKCKFIGAN